MSEVTQAAQVNEPLRVKTVIKKNEEGEIEVECTHRLPPVATVLAQLSVGDRRKYKPKSYWTLETNIAKSQEVIPFQTWADAISAAVMTRMANDQGATSELHHLAQGGYLAMGDTIYKLSAVGMAGEMKALQVAKKKLKEKAELEAKTLLESAKVSAEALLRNAAQKRQEADSYRAQVEREIGQIPPKWLVDTSYPIKFDRYTMRWIAQLQINFSITAFDLKFQSSRTNYETRTFTWAAPMADARIIRLWVPFNREGEFTATQIAVDQSDPTLPHINHSGGCMGLSLAPKQLKSSRDLHLLKRALEDCHRKVQLDSLFTPSAEWSKSFAEFVPKELKEILACSHVEVLGKLIALAEKQGGEKYEEEKPSEVWTTT